MSENQTHLYEGLFLFPQSAGTDLGAAAEHIQQLLAKCNAEVISFSKWEERRLAYEIKGNKRGVFFLSYFKVAADQMGALDRTFGLSEDLLRFLITRADHMQVEELEAAEGRDALKEEIATRALQAETGTTDTGVRATTRADREATQATTATEAPAEAAPAEAAPAESAPEAPEASDAKGDTDEAVATTDA
jgi:small subunit ribosomal protein S6